MTDETLSQEIAEEHKTNAPSISERKREANRKNAQRSTGPTTAQPDDKSQPEKQPVSIRKVEANRRNAQRSTGPRTLRGKAHSRRNATKHGLFIRYDVLFDEENPLETEGYYKRLRNELQPMGLLEEFEVEYIAICWLRLSPNL
jgi:hypothetical protein